MSNLKTVLTPVLVGQQVYYEATGERLAFTEAIQAIAEIEQIPVAEVQALVDREFQALIDK